MADLFVTTYQIGGDFELTWEVGDMITRERLCATHTMNMAISIAQRMGNLVQLNGLPYKKVINTPYIVSAALKYHDIVIAGPRHFDHIISKITEILRDYPDVVDTKPIQGFIDQNGIFYTREEALKIATYNNQILRPKGSPKHLLFSEDLY